VTQPELFNELCQLAGISLGSNTQGQEFIRLTCYCDFEGFGRASETWEEHWNLELPQMRPHWRSTTGWRECNAEAKGCMKFHGRSPDDVTLQAVTFLRAMARQQGRAIP
jgi:hypothetical protein